LPSGPRHPRFENERGVCACVGVCVGATQNVTRTTKPRAELAKHLGFGF
jgi:hypothetical protein